MKKFIRKRRFRRRVYGKKRVFKKRLPMSRMPRALIPERKVVLQYPMWSAETLDTPGGNGPSIFPLIQIANGTNIYNRVGQEVFVRGIALKGYVVGSTSQNFDSWRIDIVEDNEPIGSVLTTGTYANWKTIYDTTGTLQSANAANTMNAYIDPLQIGRYKILRTFRRTDNTYISAIANVTSGSSTNTPQQHLINCYIKVNKRMRFNVSGTAYPWVGKQIYIIGWSTTDSNTPVVFMNSKLYFNDVA